jgi:hypothetical protein
MGDSVETQVPRLVVSHQDAWQMVLSQLRSEMSRALFETWVEPLRALGYHDRVFRLGAANPYARDWVEARLKSRIARLLEGLLNEPVAVQIVVTNGFYPGAEQGTVPGGSTPTRAAPGPAEAGGGDARPAAAAMDGESISAAVQAEPPPSNRKLMLQRAYGSRRASIIQPERGMFLTQYFFNKWLPLLGHSAATIILAARSLCYWNPMTGELRNTIETEMGELAQRAAVSVRTVKDVLSGELVQRYFLRYKVRRIMTPNGVRTAGIVLQVRMDDPLTPSDQAENNLPEEEHWYSAEFEGEED